MSEHLLGLDHALDLAARGWPVMPYQDREDRKQLAGWSAPDGSSIATTDTEQIEQWFGPGQPFAECFVGVVPGLVGKTCIDIDNHGADKPNGFDTVRELRLPASAMTIGTSKSGNGTHLWFHGSGTSKPIYPGIDRKSKGGLVRVPYLLPELDQVYEGLPAPYAINNNPPTGREFVGPMLTWLELHEGKSETSKVRTAIESAPRPFGGHGDMLRVQARLVILATEGEGGVPEGLMTLLEAWLEAAHESGDPKAEYMRALAGAITAFGGDAPAVSESIDPEFFFEKGLGLLVNKLADKIRHGLAIGPDGQIWVYHDGVYRRSDSEIEHRLVKALAYRYRVIHTKEVRSYLLASRDLPLLPELPDQRYLNLRNGMLDWKTGELVTHDPSYRSIVQLPISYDAKATCPNFDKWLGEVVNADALATVWEALGYATLPGNPLQSAILLKGPAGSGKSTFLRVLENLLGANNVSNVTLRRISEGRFNLAGLAGMIANIAGDIDSKYLDDSSTFKSITGEDSVTGEHKYGKPFTFQVWAVPIFSTNSFWKSADTDDSYFRRWVVLGFPNKVRGSKNFNEQDLYDESSGILNKAVLNLRVLMGRGQFEAHGSLLRLRDEFMAESDGVRLWLQEDDEIAAHDAGSELYSTKRSMVYDHYARWCREGSLKPLGRPEFIKSMRKLGYKEKKNEVEYFLGIRFKVRSLADAAERFGSSDGR
jgi:putative DNA primase/helicase